MLISLAVVFFRFSVHVRGGIPQLHRALVSFGVLPFGWSFPGPHHSSVSGHCCGQETALLRSVWGPTYSAHSQKAAGAAKHLCNLRTNVETPVRNLTDHLRSWAHGCLSVMPPKALESYFYILYLRYFPLTSLLGAILNFEFHDTNFGFLSWEHLTSHLLTCHHFWFQF